MRWIGQWRKLLLLSAVAIPYLGSMVSFGQAPRQNGLSLPPVDNKTAISFFTFGDTDSHWRQPMNFFVAGPNDLKLHTVFTERRGWETWITVAEMQAIIDKLSQTDLNWWQSKKVEPFKEWLQRSDGNNSFSITVNSSAGTAKTHIRMTRMCNDLTQFDSVMPTPRILWQFRTLRWDDGCDIAGYHNEILPPD